MADRVSQMGLSDLITGGKAAPPPAGDWQDVPPVRVPSSDGWEDVPPPSPSPLAGEGTSGTQGISDRLTRGIQPDQSWKLQDRQARLGEPSGTAEFAREGFHQIVDAITGTGPSQFDDLRPEVEKQLISIGRTPEVAKQEAERIGQSFKRQERMGGLLMGPLTVLTAPLLGAYRNFVSRPIEEATGFPKEATETFTMAGLAVAGLPAMSKQMARVKITSDGKVTAQAIGDLPKAEDFKTAAELLTTPEEPAPAAIQKQMAPGVFVEGNQVSFEGAPRGDYIKKIASQEVPVPSAGDLADAIKATTEAEKKYYLAAGLTETEYKRLGTLDRIADTAGGEPADAAIREKKALINKLPPETAGHEFDLLDVSQLQQLRREFESLERSELETPAEHMDGIARVLKRYIGDVMDGDPFARAVFRKAMEESQKAGFDTKTLTNDIIRKYMSDLSESDQAFMRKEFENFLRPKLAVDPAVTEQNLRTLWDERGIHPAEALHDAKSDAFLKHELTQPDRSVPEGATLEGISYRLPIRDAAGADVGGLKFDFQDIIDGPGIIKVTGAGLDEAAQGKGLGIRAYQQLADFALQNGRELWSDQSVSPEAARMYDALERRGYKVERIAPEDVTSIYDPAFKVTSGPAKEAAAPHPDRPLGEALRATDELRAANRNLPDQDRAILGELISAVRGAAAKRQLSVEGASVKNVDISFPKVRVKDIPETGGQQAFILKPDGAIHDLGELKGGHLQAIGDMAKAEGVEVATSTEGGKYAEGQLGLDEYQRQRGLIGVTRYNNSLGFNIVESLTRQQLSAIREMVKKLGSEEVIFSVTDRNGQDKLYSKDINDLQKFVGANASVVMQGDRFKKGPVPDVPPATDAIADHAWVEADQDLARAHAAMARIEEVKARHPELSDTIGKLEQAVEDALAQRDAMRPGEPRSLGAAGNMGDTALSRRIQEAYLEISGGEWDKRISIADLRKQLPDVDKATLDAELIKLAVSERDFGLFGLDNPRNITKDIAAGALKIAGAERHVLRIRQPFRSLGAAAADPPMTPLTEQPPPPAGALMASAQEGIRSLFDIGRDIQMKVAPMATGTRDSILAAKDFANTMRKNRWEWARIHDYLTKNFTPESWKAMWDRADEESVLRQEVAAGPKGVPQVKPGFVRFFHGYDESNKPTLGGGRWVTTDPEYAKNFRSAGTPKDVAYVDIPVGDPTEVAARAWDPVMDAGTNMVGRYNHIEVPENWAKQMKPFKETAIGKDGAAEHMGLATLEPAERAIVEGLHARAQNAWLRARDIGLVEGEGLPAYTPRMVINAAGAIAEQGALPLNSIGTNLKASTARLMKRKYLTAEETEAAAKAKTGYAEALKAKSMDEINAAMEKVELVRDIRTLPLAIAQLEDAIAGRTLVNEIKRAGKAGGSETVTEGAVPAGSDQKWFTIDHPALKTWRPKFEEVDGKLQTVKDADGNVIFEQVPIYIRGDFEGPLRAVLDTKSGAAYQALMSLKGKTMSVIMYSPAIHNLVEFGRAFPAMPTRIFKAYFDGNRAKNDVAIMTEAIDSGLVPIGKRFFNQDIDAIMESPDLTPGRSWTAKIASAVLTSERLLPQTDWMRASSEADALAIKRGIDKMGDFWHNTLLWDRIGDLQMGLYTNLRGDLIGKGVDPKTASITAAHWANRYAGALPQEAMSSAARKSANMLLFSRSFTMGNLGVMKDMVIGLPKDALAMIEREGGFKPGSLSSAEDIPQVGDFTKGMARRKAMMVVALDIALMYVGNSVLQSSLDVMLGDKTIDEEAHGYTRRFKETLNDINTHPLSLLQPFSIAERLSATGDNEPGRRDRIRIGYQSDGTAIYARNPVGKIGEEFIGYMSNPLEMLRKKEGTVARPLLQIFQNDKGFGRKVYDPNAETPMDKAAAIWAMVEHFAKAQTPEGQINALSDLVKGEGDPKTSTLQTLGPFAGVTFSKGAPGGPATGELYDYRQRHDVKVNMALPDIRKQILRGDVGGALQRMRELEIPPGLQKFYVRTTLDPSTRVGGRTLRDFYMGATPEQRDRLERARQ